MKITALRISVLIILTLFIDTLGAQEVFRIQNRWKPAEYVHVEQALPASGPIQPGWLSAQWVFEPVPGEAYFRIRNRWRESAYLNTENGRLEAGQILPGWWSAQWSIAQVDGSYIRIRNRWQPEQVLHNQNGALAAGPADQGWWSAQWQLTRAGQNPTSSAQPAPAAPSQPAQAAQAAPRQSSPPALPINDMRLFSPRFNGTVGMVLVRYTDQISTMMDLQVRRGDRIYFFEQRLPDVNRDGISFNPDRPEIGGQVFTVVETTPRIILDRPMPMLRNRGNSTFAFAVEVFR